MFQVPVADVLSRVGPSGRTEIKGLGVTIHEITPDLSHIQVETIQQATKEDPTLQLLMQQLMEGWKEHVKQVPRDLKPFWQLRDDLSIEHGCVLFQDMFYIPQALRSHCLKTLHQGNPGITKMRLRAQTSMYWIGIGKQIENHVLHPAMSDSQQVTTERTSHSSWSPK